MSKDTLLNNNKLSNKFVTNLDPCKNLKTKNDHVSKKIIRFVIKTNKVL